MLRTTRSLYAAGAAVIVVLLIAVLLGSRLSTPSGTGTASAAAASSGPGQIIVESDWTVAAGNLHELKAQSPLAALGTVVGIASTSTSDPRFANTPTHTWLFRLDRTLKGDVKAGTVVQVAQVGGTDAQGRTAVEQDDPLLAVGERAVLFLWQNPKGFQPDEQGSQPYYVLFDGGVGHFTVDAAGTVTQRTPWGVPAKGATTKAAAIAHMPLSVFLAQVQAA